ncbi:LON peptidase substrate-binding domain-containing protein [Candidatus Cyanaurora vandensis]|uniref:LON peptidase substrate-binding domain-containing protein n=1 Tax=Candidatus Cyanaurora vandensis TaxID=2714958 RepID=UPI00257D5502|nr:LON peptidase substrate-binding domain-containing protein [Candidatus Cyanaurora vandensis]
MPLSSATVELPLFPLPESVLFPGQPLPLHIFEPRYRIMMNTALDTDRRFGVLLWNPQTNEPCSVGGCAEILEAKRLENDCLNVMTRGQQRFRVLRYTRTKPYRVGLVEWIEDEPLANNPTQLITEARKLLVDVVRLSSKLRDQDIPLPPLPTEARELSYWIGGSFYGASEEQQLLLEMQDTEERLQREIEILQTSLKHLAARTVLKDTLKDSLED